MRRLHCLQAQPNAGHHALVLLERYLVKNGKRFLLATQNIDGLHLRAGSSSDCLIELHGNINYCRSVVLLPNPVTNSSLHEIPEEGFTELPPYNSANEMLRPHIVWFNEQLDPCHLELCYAFASNCDLCFSVGTMGAVFPAAEFPIVAKHAGALTIEVNPARTKISGYMDVVINMPAAVALPLLFNQLKST